MEMGKAWGTNGGEEGGRRYSGLRKVIDNSVWPLLSEIYIRHSGRSITNST